MQSEYLCRTSYFAENPTVKPCLQSESLWGICVVQIEYFRGIMLCRVNFFPSRNYIVYYECVCCFSAESHDVPAVNSSSEPWCLQWVHLRNHDVPSEYLCVTNLRSINTSKLQRTSLMCGVNSSPLQSLERFYELANCERFLCRQLKFFRHCSRQNSN